MIDLDERKSSTADVALLLEGSYPYVSGGVSSWAHHLIKAYPEYKFAVIFLGTTPEDYTVPRYTLPDNVVHYESIYLFPSKIDSVRNRVIKKLREKGSLRDWITNDSARKFLDANRDLDFHLGLTRSFKGIRLDQRMEAWNRLVKNYVSLPSIPSFIQYYWNALALQRPLWNVIASLDSFIDVKVVHSLSTGYAGLLGALLRDYRKFPFVLTEHGIYTRERRIELWQIWLQQENFSLEDVFGEHSFFQNLWIRFFELLSKICYESANSILSIYPEARDMQIEEGAFPDKTSVIPNGVNIADYMPLRHKLGANDKPVIAFIGRIVPIKDVKTLIKAHHLVLQHIPDAELWIVGDGEEEPSYVTECENLIISLNTEDKVKFTGWIDVKDVLQKISLVVLSSMSESMPLTILESFAAGVPVVSTDVGSCKELVYGDKKDAGLGKAGAIVGIGDPVQMAREINELLQNESKWSSAQASAIKRVEKLYDEKMMLKDYKQIYEKFLRD